MDIKAQIKDKLRKALLDLGIEGLEIELEQPKELSFGDYTTNAAMKAFATPNLKSKILNLKSPKELAERIVEIFNSKFVIHDSTVGKVEVVGGFINFHLSVNYLGTWLEEVLRDNEKLVNKPKSSSNKIVVEYSSPNIAKPFTIGHLRSTIIGDAVANLLEVTGRKVYRDNHIGDWGSQFGKLTYAIKTWGNEEEIEKAENPVKELVNLYIKFHEEAEKNPKLEDYGREWFKKLEDGDLEARRLWQKCIDWSWMEFNNLYSELNVKFTENNGRGYGESFFEDKMKQVIEELREKDLLKEDQEAFLIYFKNDKLPPLMILKTDGTTLYATRDLATDKFRLEKYGKDIKIINEVGAEQSLYFQQLFELEKMLGWFNAGQRVHVRHGLYRFKDQKMSTRKGNVIWLEDLLNEAEKRALSLSKQDSISISQNARRIGIGALKWNDLKRNSIQDIIFDWEDILNMQGDSGPYMQYTYARTHSVLAKVKSSSNAKATADKEKLKVKSSIQDLKFDELEKEEIHLLRYLYRYSDVVTQAADSLSPNIICNYLFNLAQKFNLFYQKHKVIGSDNEDQRLALVSLTGITIKHGLGILNIEVPEKV